MNPRILALLAVSIPAAAVPAAAHEVLSRGRWPLVAVEIRIDGATTPLYDAVDASGRSYFEARAGAPYEIVLRNRTGGRIGVDLDVDGLNVISGERDHAGSPGRMYILDPWQEATIRGWRSSLAEVRRFTFIDERRSYAARSGKANEKMGWVEVAAYRERRPLRAMAQLERSEAGPEAETDSGARARSDQSADAAPAAAAPEAKAAAGAARESRRSYPGTGWGERTDDRVQLVDFDYEPVAAQNVTLRYEYASGLRALGIIPDAPYGRDRLHDRDRGRDTLGFAKAPAN